MKVQISSFFCTRDDKKRIKSVEKFLERTNRRNNCALNKSKKTGKSRIRKNKLKMKSTKTLAMPSGKKRTKNTSI